MKMQIDFFLNVTSRGEYIDTNVFEDDADSVFRVEGQFLIFKLLHIKRH